jgi:hypothetical protein
MSAHTVTIMVPLAENETVFLLHAVQAALKAYRDNRQNSDNVNDKGVATAMDEAYLQPPSSRSAS